MKKPTLCVLATFLTIARASAQTPTGVPKPSDDPVDLTNPAELIIFVILPLCMVLFYFLWRKKRKK